MTRIYWRLLFFFILLSSNLLAGSYPNEYTLRDEIQFADSNSLYFKFNNCNFLWNNEFFNDVVEGYTLIGYHITPTLQYHFSKNIKIEAGVHLLQYSGLDKFSTIAPVYRASYQKNDFSFILGTLYGTANHRLSDPMYFFEQYFTSNLENGVQAIWMKERFELDVWLDWRNFIFLNDSTQEQLTAGISSEVSPVKSDNWKVSFPISLLLNHRGGQIDTSSNRMLTAMNYGLGINVGHYFDSKIISGVEADVQYLGFIDNSPTVESIYDNGMGILSEVRIKRNESFLQLGYWYGNQFLSLQGHPMYQCESVKGDEFNKSERNLLTGKIFYSKSIYKGIYIGLMGEFFYDLESQNIDHTMGVTLLIKHDFFLKRFNSKTRQE